MSDKSISDLLSEFGITHVRDDKSTSDGAHELFVGDIPLGRYDAGQAVKLLTVLRELRKANARGGRIVHRVFGAA